MEQLNVINLGHVCVDHNISEHGFEYRAAGSPAMFMALVFSKLSANYSIVSSYGNDFAEHRNGTQLYPPEANAQSTLVYFNDSSGAHRIQKALNRNDSAPVNTDEALTAKLAEAGIYITSPILPNYSLEYLQEQTGALPDDCLKILLPQGFFREFSEDDRVVFRQFEGATDFISLYDYTILSEEDYPGIDQLATEWAAATGKKIIITRGANGASIVSALGITDIPTYPVTDVVDSVGCGDVFSAAFAYYLKISGSETESVRFAHKIAGNALKYTPDQMRSLDFVNEVI